MSFLTKGWKIALSIIPCLFLTGCIQKLTINTYADKASIPRGFPAQKKFFVGVKNSDLFVNEISQKIIHILKAMGYQATNDIHEADYCLVFNADMKEEKVTIDTPVCIPGETQTRTGSVDDCDGHTQYQEETKSSDRIIYVPQEHTFFTKSMFIWVYDAKKYREDRQEKLIWQGSSASCGEAPDLRNAADYLLISIFEYFGKDTRKIRNIRLFNRNKNVMALRHNPERLFRKKRRKRRRRQKPERLFVQKKSVQQNVLNR